MRVPQSELRHIVGTELPAIDGFVIESLVEESLRYGQLVTPGRGPQSTLLSKILGELLEDGMQLAIAAFWDGFRNQTCIPQVA